MQIQLEDADGDVQQRKGDVSPTGAGFREIVVHRRRAPMKALQDRWTVLHRQDEQDDLRSLNLRGLMPESWLCLDCGVNTAPGWPNRKEAELAFLLHGKTPCKMTEELEVYTVKEEVWQETGLEGMG